MIENYCLCCHRKMRDDDYASLFYQSDLICRKCRQKLNMFPVNMKISKLKVQALYPYSGFAREMILQYKEDLDEALAPVFLYNLRNRLHEKYKDYVLVEIPSSAEMTETRGFHHVREMFSILDLPFCDILEKTQNIDQKAQSFEKRNEISRYLRLKNDCTVHKNVLIVDDIVTSGNSLQAAYNLIKPLCNKEIRALVVCFNEKNQNLFIRKAIKHL
ncbi:MAG: ComF family protein [Erysipelotrichaceae bacterium]|nr:ComF family protein [Erysipelotrichaceae bacterium]